MEQPFLHRAKDFRRMAWQSLKGVWGIAIVVALVAALLGASSSVALPTFRINVNVQDDQTMEQMAVLEQQLDELEAVGNPEDEQLVEHLRTFSLMSGKLQEAEERTDGDAEGYPEDDFEPEYGTASAITADEAIA